MIGTQSQHAAHQKWWTHKGSNLGPLPCEGNALPLSYASGILVHDQRPASGRLIGKYRSLTAIYEGQAMGVKLSARNHAEPSGRLLLVGAGGVGLQCPDTLGQRPAAFAVAAAGRRATRCAAIGRSCRH